MAKLEAYFTLLIWLNENVPFINAVDNSDCKNTIIYSEFKYIIH